MAKDIKEIAELYEELKKVVVNFANKEGKKVYVKKVVIDFNVTSITYATLEDVNSESCPSALYEADSTITFNNKW